MVMHLDLSNSKQDEESSLYRLGSRIKEFRTLVLGHYHYIDVICIKEVRGCLDAHGRSMLTAHQVVEAIIDGIPELSLAACVPMEVYPKRNGRGGISFNPHYLAHVYNNTRVVLKDIDIKRDGPTLPPDHPDAKICLSHPLCDGLFLTTFYSKLDSKGIPEIIDTPVTSCHLPMQDEYKTEWLKYMVAKADEAPWSCDRSILCGDFNTFRDDAHRDVQLSCIGKLGTEVSAKMTDYFEKPLYGTFEPFPHNKPPVKIDSPYSSSGKASKLDYAIVGKAWQPMQCVLIDPVAGSENLDKFSDHWPMIFGVREKAPFEAPKVLTDIDADCGDRIPLGPVILAPGGPN